MILVKNKMILNNEQILELINIIKFQHLFYIAENVGKDILNSEDISLLKKYGINIEDFNKFTPFEDVFLFGILSSQLGLIKSKKVNYENLKNFLSEGKFQPLSNVENQALLSAKLRASKDIRGLGNRISDDLQNELIEIDKKQRLRYEKIIGNETEINILNKGSIKDLVSNLGHKTGDWARDFGRISDFVMHSAFEEGRSIDIENRFGLDCEVYKNVYEKACKHCQKLYLTNGIGSEPILYSLKDLRDNGTNIGVNVSDWKAVIGSTHPWCRCTISYRDPNYDWDAKTQSYNLPKEYVRKVERKSKVKISIGDKTIIV